MAQPLANHTTFKLGGKPKLWFALTKLEDIPAALAQVKQEGLSWQVLGGGSNTIFAGGESELAILKMELKGRGVVSDSEDSVLIKAQAGEDWDELVAWSAEQDLLGIESLSLIPGTVGATPVQNVGAYGQEVAETIKEVEVYDVAAQKFTILSNQDCQFNYRDSLFKRDPGRYIIVSVTYALKRGKAGLAAKTRAEVIALRQSKLLDPKDVPNVGSFFKNPIVSKEVGEKLKQKYPEIPVYLVDEEKVKLSAGWLIEQAGLKGYTQDAFAVSAKHALVLTHNGGGQSSDLFKLIDHIKNTVHDRFDIWLEPEPVICAKSNQL